MKTRLFIFTALLAAFFSCKKDDSQKKEETISSKDPVALSKSVRVYHGERIQGLIPAPTGGSSAPAILSPENGTVMALAGKFAIIKPIILSGEIAGYYLSVNGASEYFKIDFSKARILLNGRGLKPKKKTSLLKPFGTDSTGNTNGDSSIVITLPPDIQTPDTICITYSPYDAQGHIGDPVTTCIIVNKPGGDEASSWLSGSWRVSAERDDAGSAWEEYAALGVMAAEKNGWGYSCEYDSLQGGNRVFQISCPDNNCPNIIAYDSLRINKDSLTFGAGGNMQYIHDETWKHLSFMDMPCNQLSFFEDSYTDFIIGSWSVENNRLILIYEFNDSGEPEYDAAEAQITKVSDTEFIITEDDGYQVKCKKI